MELFYKCIKGGIKSVRFTFTYTILISSDTTEETVFYNSIDSLKPIEF